MARRNLAGSFFTPDSISSALEVIDSATQNLADDGKLPDSGITYAIELANRFLAGPDGTVKTKAVPTFRALAISDLPLSYIEWTSFTPTRTAATGTWTVGTESGRCKIDGKRAHIQYSITGSTLSAGTAFTSLTLPLGITSAQPLRELVAIRDNGTYGVGVMAINASSTVLTFYTSINFAGWAGGATNNDVFIDVAFEIV